MYLCYIQHATSTDSTNTDTLESDLKQIDIATSIITSDASTFQPDIEMKNKNPKTQESTPGKTNKYS